MRGLLLTSIAFAGACAALTPALATNGAYRTLPLQNPAACARACADDGLCIAWTLTADACALSAIAPSSWPENATDMGLSARAPQFASLPERPQTLTPAPMPTAAQPERPAPEDDVGYALLGGPDDDAIRPRRASLY